MSATARLVVQMTPTEKTALDQRARHVGLTTSEFVRRRISEEETVDNREEIEALLSAIQTSSPAILKTLDEALAELGTLKTSIDALSGKPPA